jgi:hypothetical protein
MASDSDWVEDVRRWCFSQKQGASSSVSASAPANTDDDELGYEAANPPVQAQHWPDRPSAAVQDPSA